MMLFKMVNKESFRKHYVSLDNLFNNFKIFLETSTKLTNLALKHFMLELWTSLRETTSIKKSNTAVSLQWPKWSRFLTKFSANKRSTLLSLYMEKDFNLNWQENQL